MVQWDRAENPGLCILKQEKLIHNKIDSSVLLRKECTSYSTVLAQSSLYGVGGDGPLSYSIIRHKLQNLQNLKCKEAIQIYKEI